MLHNVVIYILANQHAIFFSEFKLKSISDDVPIYIIWSMYLSVFGLHLPIRHMLGVIKGLLARHEWGMLIKIRNRHIITIYLVVTWYWWKSSNLAFSTHSLTHSLTLLRLYIPWYVRAEYLLHVHTVHVYWLGLHM